MQKSEHKDTDDDRLELAVEFKATDDAEQIATGIVMVPNKVDLHGDFVRPETIRQFAEQFGNFESVGEGGGGVMHAVWPDEVINLERNEVLDEAAEIGGETAPADAWVQAWHFDDEELWSLVSDGILGGYSIGAVNVDFGGPFDPDDVPNDVDVPDDHPDGELVWHLRDGLIREVSAVDIPAVPDALILETKSADGTNKRLSDHLGDRDGFVDEAMERGHTEGEAERLWDVLDRFVGIEGSSDPGTKEYGRFARAGKAFLNALSGTSGAGGHDAQQPAEPAESGRDADADVSKNLHELMDEDEFSDVLKDIQTTQDELNERMDALDTDTDDGADGDGTDGDDEIELTVDDETVTLDSDDLSDAGRTAIENALADAGGDDDGSEKAAGDPDRVDGLADKVDDLAETTKTTNELVLRMADANGVSKQADIETGGAGGTEKQEGLDGLAGMMS